MPRRDEGATGLTQRTRVKTDLFVATDGSLVDASGNVVGLTGAQTAAAQALVSGAGKANRTYTLCGSSRTAYCHDPLTAAGLGATLVDMGNGRCRVSGTKIARIFRRGMKIKVGGNAQANLNQFQAPVVDHDNTATLGWFEYDITSAMFSPVVATVELTIINEQDNTPYAARGYGAYLNQLLGRNWRCLGNFAMGGGDTEQNLAVFDATHGVVRPQYIIGDIPSTNDVYARQWSADRIKTATLAFVAKCLSAGAVPVLFTIAPRTSGVTAPLLAVHMEILAWAKQVLPGLGVILLDSAKAIGNGLTFANVADANFGSNTGFLHDGVHDDRLAGRALAALAYTRLQDLAPKAVSSIIGGAAESASAKSLFKNVALAASPGTAPGTGFSGVNLPEGVTATRTGTPTAVIATAARSVASDGDAFGNNLTFTITAGANNDAVTLLFSVSGAQAAGSIVSSAIRLAVTGQSAVRGITVGLRGRYTAEDAINADKWARLLNINGTNPVNDDLVFDPCDLPDLQLTKAEDYLQTMTSLAIEVVITFSGAGGAVVKVAQPSMISYVP